jgi:hypothetical protein
MRKRDELTDPKIIEAEQCARRMQYEREHPPAWRCACGWGGYPDEMPGNPSGSRVCPNCGGSGGLIMLEPAIPSR